MPSQPTAVSARIDLLVEICQATEVLDQLKKRPMFRPPGETVKGVFVPNNRLLAFVMLMGAAGIRADDEPAVAALEESCRRAGKGSAPLANRGKRVGAALRRDGGDLPAAPLGANYLRELAEGLGLSDRQRSRLSMLNERLAKEPANEPIRADEVAAEVRSRRVDNHSLRSARNLADDPPLARTTVDRRRLREQCQAELADGGRNRRRPLVLCGPSGAGKTSLVMRLIDQDLGERENEQGIWIHATSREAILDGFARAGRRVQGSRRGALPLGRHNPLSSSDPLVVANTVCEIIATSSRPWYVVLDDLTDPDHLRGLKLPTGTGGRTYVTSRLEGLDSRLTAEYAIVRVGPFTPEEAKLFLQLRLAPSVESALIPYDALDAGDDLAAQLHYLPFSLDTAATTILRESITCREYCRRLDGRVDIDGVPANERIAAANWMEGLARTIYRPPAGLEARMVLLVALCGPTVPVKLFMDDPALSYLGHGEPMTADDARRCAVRLSTRGLLWFSYSQQADPAPYLAQGTVRIHDIAKRVVLATYADQIPETASVAARALRRLWGGAEPNPGRNALLRTCAQALERNSPETIWRDAAAKNHVTEFIIRSLESLGQSGQYALAAEHYAALAAEAERRFGATHLATLELRGRAAVWHGRAGDIATAIQLLEDVVHDYEQHPQRNLRLFRVFRQDLASNYGWAGDAERAITDLEVVISEWAAEAGSEEETLRGRYVRALWIGRAGDPRAAFEELERLLPRRREFMSDNRLGILRTRLQLEIWRARTGLSENRPDLRELAIENLSSLVADWVRVAGREHPDTLRARRHLAVLRTRTGDAAALADLAELQSASLTLFGPSSPDTLRCTEEFALAHGRLGDWEAARTMLASLVDSASETTPAPDRLRIRYDHACALAQLGSTREAVAELRTILDQQRAVLRPATHLDIQDTEAALHELTGTASSAGNS